MCSYDHRKNEEVLCQQCGTRCLSVLTDHVWILKLFYINSSKPAVALGEFRRVKGRCNGKGLLSPFLMRRMFKKFKEARSFTANYEKRGNQLLSPYKK